jgi:hypothetical protein
MGRPNFNRPKRHCQRSEAILRVANYGLVWIASVSLAKSDELPGGP